MLPDEKCIISRLGGQEGTGISQKEPEHYLLDRINRHKIKMGLILI